MEERLRLFVERRIKEHFPDEEIPFARKVFYASFAEIVGEVDVNFNDLVYMTRKDILRINIFLDSLICSLLFQKEIMKDKLQESCLPEIKERTRRIYDVYKSSFTELPSVSGQDNFRHYDPLVMCLRASEKYLEVINKPLSLTNPKVTLVNDIFETIFKKVAGFTQMLTLGLYPDAFVSWRTLHESECIVKLLVEGGEKTRQSYVDHIAYNNAYRNQSHFSKEELDMIFLRIKGEMKEHGLKSKDMKKFIEYGWLYSHPLYDPEDIYFKLNFRDGVEKLSGLTRYSKIYEGASEIAHSSSAFFYVNDEFCRDLSLLMVYQTFIRIHEIYHEYMRVYFSLHPEEERESLLFVEDVKRISSYLDEKIGTIEELVEND